jgi:uncharacterized membrane protein YagU involved in acid resistance
MTGSDIKEQMQGRAWATIVMAGGTAGAIDFLYASTMMMMAGQPATRAWMGVAGALFGKNMVIEIGLPMAAVGAALHFLITISAAAIFYVAAKRQPILLKHRLVSAVVFGLLFFLAMNYVIVPLSLIGRPIYVGASRIARELLTHIIVIGLPISLITAWRLNRKRTVHTGHLEPA